MEGCNYAFRALYMRFIYCARIRGMALVKAWPDLAITLAGQVLFTTAVFLRRPIKPCRRRVIQMTLMIKGFDWISM
jgi:hypothetical protein